MSDESDCRVPSLPLSGRELASRLSHTITLDAAGTVLEVTRVELLSAGGDSVSLRLAVTVMQTGGVAQYWDVEIPEESAALGDADYLVLIASAHLDEWWHTRETDPMTSTWGRPHR